MEKEIAIPEGIDVKLEAGLLTIKGPKGELRRKFTHMKVKMEIKDRKVHIRPLEDRRKTNAIVGTWEAHVKNMFTGVTHGWEGKLKVIHSHFPIKINIEGDKVLIQNFLGERKARTANIPAGVKVSPVKDEVIVTGINRELVGNACGNIECASRIKGRDKRVFQDGVYITQKPIATPASKPSEGAPGAPAKGGSK